MKLWRGAAVVGGVVVAVASLLVAAPDRQPSRRPLAQPGRATEVAGITFSRELGFENLSPRLRPPPAATPTTMEAPASAQVDSPITPPPEHFNQMVEPAAAQAVVVREARAVAPPPAGESVVAEPSPGTWAVVIGIDDYPGSGLDLDSAINDADDVSQALSRFGVAADHQLLLQDGTASLAHIRASLDWLKAHAGPAATAVFFFAGHVRKVRSGGEAIIAADGGLLTDTDLAASLSGLQAAKAWIGIAACYGGGFTEVLKPGRVLVGAAPADEQAYENDAFDRSYLVEYMVRRAMIENGISTVEDAFAAAEQALRQEFPHRVPVLFQEASEGVDLSPTPTRPASQAGG